MTPAQVESELRAGLFPSTERAVELAGLIAAEMSLAGELSGWSIEVRDSQGSRLCVVPVVSGLPA